MKNCQNIGELIQIIKEAKPRVIGVDGNTGTGKSFIARRICDEIDQYVVLEFDNFRTQNIEKVTSYELNLSDIDLIREVGRIILTTQRKIIFEGVLLLKMIEKMRIPLDFLIFVEHSRNKDSRNEEIEGYLKLYEPFRKADIVYNSNKNKYGL